MKISAFRLKFYIVCCYGTNKSESIQVKASRVYDTKFYLDQVWPGWVMHISKGHQVCMS